MRNVTTKEPCRHSNKRFRKGATAVEMAVTLPIFFLIVFASLEFGRAFVILNTAENAAYEGARRGIVPGATASECQTAAQQVISAVGTRNVTINVDPTVIQLNTPEVEVTVSVPMDSNSYIFPVFMGGRDLVGRCKLTRERFDQTSSS